MNLDDILKPDNDGIKKTSLSDAKKRLADLKSQIMADPVNIDVNSLRPTSDDFPSMQNTPKYIDYEEKRNNLTILATGVINNIVYTFIKPDKITERIKNLIDKDIINYGRKLLLLEISESNLIKAQELIDTGDMSKDMFDTVNKAQQEVRANMNAADSHLLTVEKYWKAYSEIYGLESEEDKIMQVQVDNNEDKTTIVAMTDIIDKIQKMKEEKDKIKTNKLQAEDDERSEQRKKKE